MEQAPLYQSPRLSLAIHFHRLSRFVEAEDAYFYTDRASAEITEDWRKYYRQMLKDAAVREEQLARNG